jgi:hypothetical protein
VVLGKSAKEERKHVITLAKFDKHKSKPLLCCKTTSKNHEKLFAGEFIISDLFSRGPSKIQPTNLVRVPDQTLLDGFYFLGILDELELPKFELGLKQIIKANLVSAVEKLEIMDAWSPFFPI